VNASPPHRPQPFLSLREAAFRLGERIVFPKTNWVFARDQHWAILGANGSGKSLLADALRGLLPLVQGDLRYHFQPPHGLTPEEAIGHVSFEQRKAELHDTVVQSRWNSLEQEGTLLVREFLSYERVMDINPFEVTSRHRQARPQFERRLRRAVSLLGVAPLLDRALLSLSNGERQKVELARALSHPMRLLILDEPFSGLDKANRAHFHAILESLMATSLRVLLVATRIEDLPHHITHVLCVADCQVVAAGPRMDILSSTRRPSPLLLWRRGLGRGGPQDRKVRTSNIQHPTSNIQRPQSTQSLDVGCSMLDVGCSPHSSRGRPLYPRPGLELVRMRRITVRYGNSVVLRDINWTIRAGESWALLGPNGSGKTTLLSLIIGDHPQVYANDVTVFGQPRGNGESMWEIKQHIGWVSPELHLHFNASATCFEVVASGFFDSVGLFQPPSARQRTQARQWLARFQLLEYAHRPMYSLSAGLQRTVLLARSLVKNPRLLILDEPCQGLDPAHRDHFVRTVDHLILAGSVTCIYVTHRPDEIPPSIKRILRLSVGAPDARTSEAALGG
jgi:molybdate transport system ATP-binding protein